MGNVFFPFPACESSGNVYLVVETCSIMFTFPKNRYPEPSGNVKT